MEVIASRYEVLEVVKDDGERSLLRARDKQLEHMVALKVVALDRARARDELLAEARILLRLEPHPALPTMREGFALDHDRFVIVMDWIEGDNLAVVLDERGAPGLARSVVMEYVKQAAAALDHLHRHDPPIVHGDVKPSNLVLTPAGKVVLVDFGIACPAGTSAKSGTRGYLAPEVAAGDPSTPSADVYGLAATAYALLIGRPPEHTRPDWIDIDPSEVGALARAFRRALAADPARRHASAGELAEQLFAGYRALPTGVVTFLAIEFDGLSTLWDTEPEAMSALWDRLDDLVTVVVEERGGRLVRSDPDAERVLAAFSGASAAAASAMTIHERLASGERQLGRQVRAHLALHTGEVELRDGAYVGGAVVRVARLRSQTSPGTTIVSPSTAVLVRDTLPDGARLVDLPNETGEACFALHARGATAQSVPPRPTSPRSPEPSPPLSPPSPPPRSPLLDARYRDRANFETLAEHALRRADQLRRSGDGDGAAEYEASAQGFALRVVALTREIEELEPPVR